MPVKLEADEKLLAEIPLTPEQKAAIAQASGGLEFTRIAVVAKPLPSGAGRVTTIDMYCW